MTSKIIKAVTIVSDTNAPLYTKTFHDSPGETEEDLRFLYISHAALDIIEEKSMATSSGLDMYLGLLYPTDSYQVYGYISNTKTKVIIVIDDVDVKDVDVKSVLRRIHAAYVDALCNPFHVPGERLNSGRFDKAVLRIIGNF